MCIAGDFVLQFAVYVGCNFHLKPVERFRRPKEYAQTYEKCVVSVLQQRKVNQNNSTE